MTLNQIVSQLRSLASAHDQVNSFYFGDPWEFGASDKITYPFMGTVLQSGTISQKTEQTKILLFFADKVTEDEGNETHVLSDTKQIALGIFSQFKNFLQANKIQLLPEATLSDFTGAWDDDVSGWSIELTINQFFSADTCAEPSTYDPSALEYGSVIIFNIETGETITTKNPGQSYGVYVFSGIIDNGPPYTNTIVDNGPAE